MHRAMLVRCAVSVGFALLDAQERVDVPQRLHRASLEGGTSSTEQHCSERERRQSGGGVVLLEAWMKLSLSLSSRDVLLRSVPNFTSLLVRNIPQLLTISRHQHNNSVPPLLTTDDSTALDIQDTLCCPFLPASSPSASYSHLLVPFFDGESVSTASASILATTRISRVLCPGSFGLGRQEKARVEVHEHYQPTRDYRPPPHYSTLAEAKVAIYHQHVRL